MWDERYGTDEYAYGKEANEFLRESLSSLKLGSVLMLAEGEGRNAVFLAGNGFDVTAVDSSTVGLRKALRLASEHDVTIDTITADLADYEWHENRWDSVVSIFCPIPSGERRRMHRRVVECLKPGGTYLVEAYRPEQVLRETGGGKDADVLQTAASLKAELEGLSFALLRELDREVVEGRYHTGIGAVVQGIAVKPLP